jgi:hypothetical protein
MTTEAEIHSALLAIYSRLDVIEGKVTVIARANRDELLEGLEKAIAADPILGRIYLALDGRKNQGQITKDLGSSEPTISRRLVKMSRDYGIVEVAAEASGGKVYRHNKEMEEVLHLSSNVKKWLEKMDKAKAKDAKAGAKARQAKATKV